MILNQIFKSNLTEGRRMGSKKAQILAFARPSRKPGGGQKKSSTKSKLSMPGCFGATCFLADERHGELLSALFAVSCAQK
jgi:hypothetical protein